MFSYLYIFYAFFYFFSLLRPPAKSNICSDWIKFDEQLHSCGSSQVKHSNSHVCGEVLESLMGYKPPELQETCQITSVGKIYFNVHAVTLDWKDEINAHDGKSGEDRRGWQIQIKKEQRFGLKVFKKLIKRWKIVLLHVHHMTAEPKCK